MLYVQFKSTGTYLVLQNWKEMLLQCTCNVNEGYLSCQMDTVP